MNTFIVNTRDCMNMQSETIEVGMQVRYPRTGTTGKVQEIREFDGRDFARIDKTDLFYRIDTLITVAEVAEKKRDLTVKQDLERFEKEQIVSESELRDSIDDVSGVGAG
jgi:hypothetical protein